MPLCSILNKLTPEKYDILLEQLLAAGIDTSELMQTCISLLFDKAVLEPTFCSIYADLCVSLSSALPEFPDPDDPTKPQTFRRVLLNTCQVEFEGAKELRREVKAMVDPAQVRGHT